MKDGPDLVADVSVVLERLLQADQGVQAVVVFADRDMRADLGSAVDQPLVFEDGQRLANGIARHEEFGCQLVLARQPAVVGAAVNLVPQHVGDLAGAVRSGAPDRRRFGLRHPITVILHIGCRIAPQKPPARAWSLRRLRAGLTRQKALQNRYCAIARQSGLNNRAERNTGPSTRRRAVDGALMVETPPGSARPRLG